MSSTATPLEELRPRRSRRTVGAFAALAVTTLIGVPAALAAVWSVNEVTSNWTLTDCLSKIAGSDSTTYGDDATDTPYVKFDNTTTNTDATGATVLQETLTVRAPSGHITYSTDTFRVKNNNCGQSFNVKLSVLPTNSFGQTATAGVWSDKSVQLYLAEIPAAGDDFSNATDWDQVPLHVNGTGVVVDESGSAVLANNTELKVGFRLAGNTPAAALGTLRFQVEFIPV